jgi:hypothetical protein
MRTSTIAAGLSAAVLLVGGCGSDPADPGGEGEPGSQADANGEVDAPIPGGDQPSANLPGLPIGGQVPDTALTTTSPSGCGTVAWVGPEELIPEGIAVVITAFDLPDQVSVDNSACAGAGPACLGGVTFRAGQTSCTLGVRWNGETPDTLSVGADGTALCDDQAVCDRFKDSLVSQTAFLAIEASEPEEEVSPEDGDSLMTPSMSDPPSDGTE